MYRSILVPLDGTYFGEHALAPALAIARRTGAKLHLVHVHVPEGSWSALGALPQWGASLRDVVVQREQGYLREVMERISRLAGVPVDAQVLDGPIARTLAEQAQGADVDLVALSTHARTGVSRLWHHGVAAYLTRHLSVPLLMVHAPDHPAEIEREAGFGRVVLPLGGKAYNERVLDHAVELGRVFGARYTLLEVVAPPVDVGYTLLGSEGHVNEFQLESRREEALRYLEGLADRLRQRGLEVDADVVASGDAATGIVEYVERAEGGVDLVAMETHGLGGAAHLFTPSVVESVVHDTRVPVLVHHTAEVPHAPEQEPAAEPEMGWSPHHRHTTAP